MIFNVNLKRLAFKRSIRIMGQTGHGSWILTRMVRIVSRMVRTVTRIARIVTKMLRIDISNIVIRMVRMSE